MTITTRFFVSALTAALLTAPAFAQTNNNSGHDMNQMGHSEMQQGDMDHDAMMKARAEHMIEATGIVKDIYRREGLVSVSHTAIPAINWPAMTMKFPVSDKIDLGSLSKGQTVQFTLHRSPDGSFPLVEICPTQNPSVIPGLCAPAMNLGPDSQRMDHSMMKNGDMNHDGMKH